MPDFSVAIGLLRKPLESLYVIASGSLQHKLAILKTQSKVQQLHKRLWESQRVKTIWHTEKPLSLNSFFYPVSVDSLSAPKGVGTKINALDDLPNPHTIIYGTVGQGKSIFLRYLLGRELKSGTHIPLLCELRNVESHDLFSYLNERFAALLEMPVDETLFSFFASNGKIAFLLDGFDEIDDEKVPKISHDIEDLASRFSSCRIVLSSRPDSACRHLTSFHSVKIAELTASDLEPFYRKIGHDIDFAKRLVAAVNRSPTKIRELVVTPLLATLLAVSYRAANKIPLEFSEFYEELFQILLTQHDLSKKGWRRQRRSDLNDREIQQVFEAFCFASRKRRLTALTRDDTLLVAKESLVGLNLRSDPQNVIDDIRRVTCLLVEEGGKLQFVHNSVQEFFAARFVKIRNDAVAANFYTKLLTDNKWFNWQEELVFLRQIDTHRATKYFFVPDLKKTLTFLLKGATSVSKEIAVKYLQSMSVQKKMIEREGVLGPSYFTHQIRPITTYHLRILDSRTFAQLFARGWNSGFVANPDSTERTYLQIAQDQGDSTVDALLSLVTSSISAQQAEYAARLSSIVQDEKISGLNDLDDI